MIFCAVFKSITPFEYWYMVFKRGDAFKDKSKNQIMYVNIKLFQRAFFDAGIIVIELLV